MGKPIPEEEKEAFATQVLSLYEEGTSQAAIARKLGTYPERVQHVIEMEKEGIRLPDTSRDPILCETCRRRVYPPCLACQLREKKARVVSNGTS
jgi:hypothetical protein